MSLTTISLDIALKKQLDRMKVDPRESYNRVLRRVLQEAREKKALEQEAVSETIEILSDPEIMQALARSVKQLKEGRVHPLEEV